MASRFFSIIHDAIIEDGELALPKEFVRKFGTELSDVAVITIPTGIVWHVQLRQAKGGNLFGKGWKEFIYRVGRKTNVFKSQSGNPAFKIVMQPAYVREGRTVVHVPVRFKAFREVNCDIVTLRDSEGRTWDVGVSTYREKQTKLMTGWSDFVLDNHLEVGDVCIFELIDRNNLQMDVTIMRAQDVV
ncbi:hypothetical protein MKX01_024797 [Papaver californicum]|nr:hypothetical protein MKX01_024797 [Papaver californicum]